MAAGCLIHSLSKHIQNTERVKLYTCINRLVWYNLNVVQADLAHVFWKYDDDFFAITRSIITQLCKQRAAITNVAYMSDFKLTQFYSKCWTILSLCQVIGTLCCNWTTQDMLSHFQRCIHIKTSWIGSSLTRFQICTKRVTTMDREQTPTTENSSLCNISCDWVVLLCASGG